VDQFVLRNEHTRAVDQVAQDVDGLRLEVQRDPAASDAEGGGIEDEVPEAVRAGQVPRFHDQTSKMGRRTV
jgi:hypothetical protein